MADRSIDTAPQRHEKFLRRIFPQVEQAAARCLAEDGLERAVAASPADEGTYRDSHRIGVGRSRRARLSRSGQRGTPGAIEVDMAFRSRRPGQDFRLTNDAPYARIVESIGWKNTPPYRVYQKTLRSQLRRWRRIAEGAWRRVVGRMR